MCVDSDILNKLPKKSTINGKFDSVKCSDIINKLLVEYSPSTLSIVKSGSVNVFHDIQKMGKPSENIFIVLHHN